MKKILVVGAGKIGEMIAALLAGTGDYEVVVIDHSDAQLAKLPPREAVRTLRIDVTDEAALAAAMAGTFAAVSAVPYDVTRHVAIAAGTAGVHYLDLTEDVATTRLVKELADGAAQAFIPQCGLAPGFISIVAHDVAKHFDELDAIRMRVGALPKYPSNALGYNLTWSTDGVINEYDEPCEAIVKGELRETSPLEELEHFALDGVQYEAFNTSGGLGTLCETLKGRVDTLNYKTIRYPGHRDVMKLLIQDLKLGQRRLLLKDVLEFSLPATTQDVVLVFVTVSGRKNGRFLQESYARKIYSGVICGVEGTGIQITTAAGICAVLDLLSDGTISQRGFVRQEDIELDRFLANRFGRAYSLVEAVKVQTG
ncbi:saccharopine dehydrogenase [Sphingopyxis lindanitolerans]|uniref:Saccharopine dehydrogenase n=1 Tax=Sphingopyxis lindanitolerans TaxID=2054227 RepID=A0A2S8B0W2_9SPHN|nr:saccharopine dehydrogenase C-terminal domain-containing protein [Sphingopyxis lindanitolerans]PQM26045.1 saccharopine dehydrogenase [Sphingopyxis lindanitolerans]